MGKIIKMGKPNKDEELRRRLLNEAIAEGKKIKKHLDKFSK